MSAEAGVLLLKTCETIVQIADVVRKSDTNPEVKIFFCHLASHCIRIRYHSSYFTETRSQLQAGPINQTLEKLTVLLANTVTGTQHMFPTGFTPTPTARLGAFNLYWSDVYKQQEETKRLFIEQWVRLAISAEQQEEVELSLESCANELEKQLPEPAPDISPKLLKLPPSIGEPSYVVRRAAESAFKALTSCSKCSCPSQHNLSAKLELGTYRKPTKITKKKVAFRSRAQNTSQDPDAAEVDLGLFLSMDRDWHEFRLQIPKERGVSFAVADETSLASSSPSQKWKSKGGGFSRVDGLCNSISKAKAKLRQRLVLILKGGELFEMGFEKSSFQVDNAASVLSLSQCIISCHSFFSEKTKRILSLILGHAILHLHGTSWLQPGWGSVHIKFFQTASSGTPL